MDIKELYIYIYIYTRPALGIGHLGPLTWKGPQIWGIKVIYIFIYLIKEKCELSVHFFPKT